MSAKFHGLGPIALLICTVGFWTTLTGQTTADPAPDVEYRIKRTIFRHYMLRGLWEMRNNPLLEYPETPKSSSRTLFRLLQNQYFGFGYSPAEPDMLIRPFTKWQYPDKRYKLYTVEFLESPLNDTLGSWYTVNRYTPIESFSAFPASIWPFIIMKHILVGVNDSGDVKIISMRHYWGHQISEDFKLNRRKPETYIPFLKFRYFAYHADFENFTYKYLRKQGKDTLVFLQEYKNGYKAEYHLDARYPDKRGATKSLYPPNSEELKRFRADTTIARITYRDYKHYTIPLGFPTLADKERYLKDALMRNLYAYRILHLENLAQRINLDTVSMLIRPGDSEIESLIPDFDEYIGNIALLKHFCCPHTDNRLCVDRDCGYPIYDGEGYIDDVLKATVGYYSYNGYIELYAFIKTQKEVLYKRPGSFHDAREQLPAKWDSVSRKGMEVRHGYTRQPRYASPWEFAVGDTNSHAWYRFDTYYFPELEGANRPPLPINADTLYYNCYHQLPVRSVIDDLKEPADFYLLALDTRTREVYFLSGEGIFLSAATNLTQSGEHPYKTNIDTQTNRPAPWLLQFKLCYIRYRLYQYLIERVRKEHIVEMTDEKIVLEVTGRPFPFRPNPYKLRVTFYEQRPEKLDVVILE